MLEIKRLLKRSIIKKGSNLSAAGLCGHNLMEAIRFMERMILQGT